MKIVYLSFEQPSVDTGVGQKLKSQIAAWRQSGHEVVNCVLRASEGEGIAARHGLRATVFGSPMLNASLHARKVSNEINRLSPDLIYMRQMTWWPGLGSILTGHNVIEEVNSDLRFELRSLPGVRTRLKTWIYDASRETIEQRLSGRVHVTRELMNRYRLEQGLNTVISNGFDFAPHADVSGRSGERRQFIMACSADRPWHGIDLLEHIAEHLPEMDFHIVGPIDRPNRRPNVRFHGIMTAAQLKSLYPAMHFGLSSLALFRKKMTEACTLKVREYVNYDLPVIAGHEDTDLSGEPYFLDIGAYVRQPSHAANRIREFVSQWENMPFPHERARSILSAYSKEVRRLAFFEEVLRANV